MTALGIILESIGVFAIFWGAILFGFNQTAIAPVYLLCGGLGSVLVGAIFV
jgi:hypothetical protein